MPSPYPYHSVYAVSQTTGLGDFQLTGPTSILPIFPPALVGLDEFYYIARDVGNRQWEMGIGTVGADGHSLQRTAVLDSSAAGVPISWGTGTREITFSSSQPLTGVAPSSANVFNPQAYGAKGDGVTDETAAFQAAINAAIAVNGTVVVPPPRTGYFFTGQLKMQPASGSQARLRIEAMGNYQSWLYSGPSNADFIVYSGLKDSYFSNINIQFASTVQGVTCWSGRPTSTFSSMGNVVWDKCRVTFQGTGGRNVGWRQGQGGGFSDQANFSWRDCLVSGEGRQYGSIGWQSGGSQNMPQLYTNCAGSQLWRLYLADALGTTNTATILIGDATLSVVDTTGFNPAGGTLQIQSEQITYTGLTPTTFTGCVRGANGTTAAAYVGTGYVINLYLDDAIPGVAPAQGLYPGGQELVWLSGGGSINAIDFHTGPDMGHAIISGHRAESGQRFLETNYGAISGATNVLVQSCSLANYAGDSNGVVFWLNRNCNFKLSHSTVTTTGPQLTAAMITEAAGSANGTISVENCSLQAVSPFATSPKGWPIYVVGCHQIPVGGGNPTGMFATQAPFATAVNALVTYLVSPTVATGSTTVNAYQVQDSLGNVWDEQHFYNGNSSWGFRYRNASRSVADCVTNSTTTITSATAAFVSTDVNVQVSGNNIPANTWIASVTNGTTAVLNQSATGSGTGALTIGGVQETPWQFLRASPTDCRLSLNANQALRMFAAGLTVGSTAGSTIVTNLTPGKQTLTFPGGGGAVASTPSSGGYMQLTATDGTAFTISNPASNASGQEISYEILNSSGGAMGTITWGAQFKLDGSWANPANTKRRVIRFVWNATNWVQVSPATGDM